MMVTLRDGKRLVLAGTIPNEVVRQPGLYFILDGRPYDNPDLSVAPALLVRADTLPEIWELRQHEVVLGKSDDVEQIS